jgi:single-strand DNA-binding protein
MMLDGEERREHKTNDQGLRLHGKGVTDMAGSVNKVILVGNLGRDPEVRRMASGEPVVNLSVATSETWRDKQSGERKERTEWHRVVIFNENLAKVAEQYLKKGSKVYVEGQLQTRKYTDQAGAEKYTTEVVLQRFRGELALLDSRGSGEGAGGGWQDEFGQSTPLDRPSGNRPQERNSFSRDLDDEVPF